MLLLLENVFDDRAGPLYRRFGAFVLLVMLQHVRSWAVSRDAGFIKPACLAWKVRDHRAVYEDLMIDKPASPFLSVLLCVLVGCNWRFLNKCLLS